MRKKQKSSKIEIPIKKDMNWEQLEAELIDLVREALPDKTLVNFRFGKNTVTFDAE